MENNARLAYFYAEIDPTDNMCVGVFRTTTSTDHLTQPNVVQISVYDEEYCFKYYNWDDGKFYYDPEYTEEYISPLL